MAANEVTSLASVAVAATSQISECVAAIQHDADGVVGRVDRITR